jgi:NADH-quinone oxidoreductase subunit M
MRRAALAAVILCLATAAAQAHTVVPGIGGFPGGLIHPLLVPAHTLSLIALGLLAGRFPSATQARLLAVFAVAALVAFAQTDLKKLIAYSSVCHMGLIVIGIFAANQTGIKGGILQMVNHGLSTGALFILVGALYERTGTRNMELMGGLARRVPVLAAFFMIVTLSSIGLPGLNGFIGEFFLLLAAFQFKWWLGALSATTMILGAIYMLWMYQRVMFEKSRAAAEKTFGDFSVRENIVMFPVIIMFLFIGLYPSFFLDRLEKTSAMLLASINRSAIAHTISAGEK